MQHETLLARLKDSLRNTRKKLGQGLLDLFRNTKKIDQVLLKKVEEQLLMSDLGVHTTDKIVSSLVKYYSNSKNSINDQDIYNKLCEDMSNMLRSVDHILTVSKDKKPFIILVVGVNGVGKTSTIGKLAYRYQKEGKKVMLGAADTFRAAAVDQLQVWGSRCSVPVVSSLGVHIDPASVVFNSIHSAQSQNIDILIIDTAGRLQNKLHLMEELKKIVRVIKKFDVSAPHEIMIVLDSTIGQNSIIQVNLFKECVGITGISMSKLDGSAKGGILFTLVDQFKIPIRYITFGKNIDDLDIFNVNNFVESIFK